MAKLKRLSILFGFLSVLCLEESTAQTEKKRIPIKHLIFERQEIEGNLGAQKAIVVSSDKRPVFKPMALKLAEDPADLSAIDKELFEFDLNSSLFPIEVPK